MSNRTRAAAMCAMLGAITAQAQMFIPVPVPGTAGAPTPPPPPTPPGTPSLWFDGSDIDGDGTYNSAYTDGDPVTTWVDKGSLGVDATQASAAAKPTYKTGGPGGSDYVLFDGSDYVATPDSSWTQWAHPHMIAVLGNPGVASSEYFVDGDTDASRSIILTLSSQWYFGTGTVAIPSGITVTNNQWEAVVGTFNGASSTLYVSGNTSSTFNTGSSGPAGLTIGARHSDAAQLAGGIIDVIAYETIGSVTASDIETYWEGETTTLPVAGTP